MVLRASGNNYCNRDAFVLFIVYRQDINREIAIFEQLIMHRNNHDAFVILMVGNLFTPVYTTSFFITLIW